MSIGAVVGVVIEIPKWSRNTHEFDRDKKVFKSKRLVSNRLS